MSDFKRYLRKVISSEMRPYRIGESVRGISISDADRALGSPKHGDMIARNPSNHDDQWLVEQRFFRDNFEGSALTPKPAPSGTQT